MLIVGAALMAGLAGCQGDRATGGQQVGVTLDQSSNMPALVIYTCSGQRLSSVTLWLMTKDGNDRVRPLWVVSRTGGADSPSRVVAGQVPEGFRQDTPLVGSLPPSGHIEFVPQFGVQAGIEFRMSDLQSDMVFVDPAWFGNHRHVSMDGFAQENVKDCGSR